jgi:peptidoglycan/xylan/chitin deacetylase (PgdA/CDA1 family)
MQSISQQKNVTLTIDGGYEATNHLLFELSQKYKIPFSVFLVTSTIGSHLKNRAVADWEFWLKAERECGWEIAAHTHTHPRLQLSWQDHLNRIINLNAKQAFALVTAPRKLRQRIAKDQTGQPTAILVQEAQYSKEILENKLNHPVTSFAYPYGQSNQNLIDHLKKMGYTSARTVDAGINQPTTKDPFKLLSNTWEKNTTLAEANAWVDELCAKGGWLIETIHVVYPQNPPDNYDLVVSQQTLENHIQYLLNKGVKVRTQSQVINLLRHDTSK